VGSAEHSDEEDINMFAGGTYLNHGLRSIIQLGHRSSFALARLLGHELWGQWYANAVHKHEAKR
jgi:hypothetical protein